ncbi:hypothetical protein ACN2EN_09165 [Aliarcobacter lanthieri]|uniref:hypothetical protein n=1 Tax=Aliarcobacter lanthieri TaxID=1355374 RepID=UPI003AFB33C3
MRKIKNSSRDLISTLPNKLNQTIIDGYRVKLFSKIKDSLEKKKLSCEKEKLEFKELLKDKIIVDIKNISINNSFYTPILGA